jgi:glyoxylase-like metal-dependent hydrolase (beta-lactamase superfamily II)
MLEVTRIENRVMTSNTFVVFDADYDYCWLVDVGDVDKVREAIPKGVEVRGVFITHSHFDHIYGMNELHNAFPSCRLYTSEFGKEAVYDDKKNFSRYHEQSIMYEGSDVKTLGEGDEVELYPGVNMHAYVTSGHCPSCLTYIVKHWIFTGDSYIPGVKVVTKLPRGNRTQAAESVEKIKSLSVRRTICPGHGENVFE